MNTSSQKENAISINGKEIEKSICDCDIMCINYQHRGNGI